MQKVTTPRIHNIIGALFAICVCIGISARHFESQVDVERFKPYAAASSVFTSAELSEGLDSCSDKFPNRTPIRTDTFPVEMRATGLCFDGFAEVYSKTSKTPIVTVERLNKKRLLDAQNEARTNIFFPDPRLAINDRAELSDYKTTIIGHYDRGHLAPAADQDTDRAMAQCFSLANMVPQAPENNRQAWAKIERDVRKYVKRASGDVFVFTGPLYAYQPITKIGTGNVWVPTHLFKLVYDESTHRAWAYVIKNEDTARVPTPITYRDFHKRTGYKFLANINVID